MIDFNTLILFKVIQLDIVNFILSNYTDMKENVKLSTIILKNGIEYLLSWNSPMFMKKSLPCFYCNLTFNQLNVSLNFKPLKKVLIFGAKMRLIITYIIKKLDVEKCPPNSINELMKFIY